MNSTLRQTSDAQCAGVADRVRSAMDECGVDLDLLALRTGIAAPDLDERLANPRQLTATDVLLIAAALDVPSPTLMLGTPEPDVTVPAWVTKAESWDDLGTADAFRLLVRAERTAAGDLLLTQSQRTDGTLGYLALDLTGAADVVLTSPAQLREIADEIAAALSHLADAYETGADR